MTVIGTDIPTAIDETSVEDVINIVNVNVTFTTRITQVMVPLLTRHKRSAIVIVSSLSALGGGAPLLTIYAGMVLDTIASFHYCFLMWFPFCYAHFHRYQSF
jgi:NAD(P)-dependent dehydrogenase (short-subunit alcohol dehydrogenase family)